VAHPPNVPIFGFYCPYLTRSVVMIACHDEVRLYRPPLNYEALEQRVSGDAIQVTCPVKAANTKTGVVLTGRQLGAGVGRRAVPLT